MKHSGPDLSHFDILTPSEAAHLLGLTAAVILSDIAVGRLPATRTSFGLQWIKRVDLELYSMTHFPRRPPTAFPLVPPAVSRQFGNLPIDVLDTLVAAFSRELLLTPDGRRVVNSILLHAQP